MGCQTEIAATIIEGKGNYLLSAKGNQPTLHQDLVRTFAEANDMRKRSADELAQPQMERFEEVDKGHGRLEKRTVAITRNLDWLTDAERWPGLKVLVQVTRERTILSTAKTSQETVHYIGSDAALSAEQAGRKIRRHWGIESELHWVLDMAFGEDNARHRAHNTAQNLTTLRHFALSIVKQDKKRKLGVANSRKRAGWDRTYLIELLTNVS
jgi:predicted transposase YbfD/YdcC